MIQPIRYSDDPILKEIPESAAEFEFENIKMVILHREKKEFDLLIINKETPGIYHHMFQEKGEIYFKRTQSFKNGTKKYEYIDLERSMKKLSEILSELVEKLEPNDGRFVGKLVYFIIIQQQFVKEKTEKKVVFGQNYDLERVLFEKIDKKLNRLGFTFDEDNKEKEMIFVKEGNIFCIDVKHLEELDNPNSSFSSKIS